jgi:hypothetical protein
MSHWVANSENTEAAGVEPAHHFVHRDAGHPLVVGQHVDVRAGKRQSRSLTLGTAIALLPGRPRVFSHAEGVDWPKVSTYIAGAMALYWVSFVLAQRPLAALRRRSGSSRC